MNNISTDNTATIPKAVRYYGASMPPKAAVKLRPVCHLKGCSNLAAPKTNYCCNAHKNKHTQHQLDTTTHGNAAPPSVQVTCHLKGCCNRSAPKSNYCCTAHEEKHTHLRTNAIKADVSAALPKPKKQNADQQRIARECHLKSCSNKSQPHSNYCCEAHTRRHSTGLATAKSPTRTVDTCSLPGCVSVSERGKGFCGDAHSALASQRGLTRLREMNTERTFQGSGWAMSLLTTAHDQHIETKNLFLSQWHKPTPPTPRVVRIFKIHNTRRVQQSYKERLRFVGNELLRFHGTGSHCGLGVHLQTAACMSPGCNTCNICARGFDVAKCNTAAFMRYGPGIYTSSVSGKANDYAKEYLIPNSARKKLTSHQTTHTTGKTATTTANQVGIGDKAQKHVSDINSAQTMVCMFLCSVAAGRVYRTTEERLTDKSKHPPSGYDSVMGEVVPGPRGLNYEELVVYNSQAVLPLFWIVYSLTY